MILSGQTIYLLNIVTPFSERTEIETSTGRKLSYGVSLAGYDVRTDQKLHLHQGSFRLASTMEHFKMPKNVVGVVHDKSSWARQGIAVQNTVLEPGWRGFLTMELTNHSERTVIIEAGWPVAQILFHYIDQPTEGYQGKYQDQERGPQEAR